MDSNELEKERGITILAKATSVLWKDTQINIVDTPGHADFGGEVERILSMVDGVIVLVDAAEGPMPQTKFVVGKALKIGLKPIVCDQQGRQAGRPADRGHQRGVRPVRRARRHRRAARFPHPLRLGQEGLDGADKPEGPSDQGMAPLFELVLRHVPPPTVEEGPFRMLGTLLEANPYLGRIITGRITSGSMKPNQQVKALSTARARRSRPAAPFQDPGLPRPRAPADRGSLCRRHRRHRRSGRRAPLPTRFCDPSIEVPLKAQPIDPPTVSDDLRRQRQPARRHRGRQGDEPRHPRAPVQGGRGQCRAEGRGERRQGRLHRRRAAASCSSPSSSSRCAARVSSLRYRARASSSRKTPKARRWSPSRRSSSTSTRSIPASSCRRCPSASRRDDRDAPLRRIDRLRLVFHAPTRGLIGYQGELLTDTRGTAIMNRLFHAYAPLEGRHRRAGATAC